MYIIFGKTGRTLHVVVPFLKVFIFGKYLSGTYTLKPTLVHKPVAKFSDSYGVVAPMCLDVATGQIRNGGLVAVWFFFQYEKRLLIEWLGAIVAASKIDSELEGHIQAVMFARVLCLASTKIMNGVSTRLYELQNFFNPWLT